MTVKNPSVSIILPTYNGSLYIDQAIDSCINQKFSDWEIIIVDDASEDDTPDRIAMWIKSDMRIKFVRNQKNLKLPRTLNRGFSKAKGKYLTWTSDDNYYQNEAIQQMVAFLESHPEADIVYTDYNLIDKKGVPFDSISVEGPEKLLIQNCVGPCFLFRKTVYERLEGYKDDLFGAEDYDFWMRASILFNLQPLNQNLYQYRIHPDSLTSRRMNSIRLATAETIRRNLPLIKWANNKLRAEAYLNLAIRFHTLNNFMATRLYLLYAMRYSINKTLRQVPIGHLSDVLFGRKLSNVFRFAYKRIVQKLFNGKNLINVQE